jgi:predicted MPP superfamily phosphohydrolase
MNHASLDTSSPIAKPAAPPAPVSAANNPGPWLQFRSAIGYEWNRADIPIPNLPAALAGLRILHLSDFHARAFWDPAYDDLIQRVSQSPPDLILFTGDFVDSKTDFRPAVPTIRKLFSALQSRLGTFSILGNHDNDLLAPAIADTNQQLIDARRATLASGNAVIELIGLPGVSRDDLNPRFLRQIPPKAPDSIRIVLSHFPDHIRRIPGLHPDLFLTGHTHGGQVCLPGGRPIISHDTLPQNMCKGIHRAFDTTLVVNKGFGFSSFVVLRTFCPAEVIELTLLPA